MLLPVSDASHDAQGRARRDQRFEERASNHRRASLSCSSRLRLADRDSGGRSNPCPGPEGSASPRGSAHRRARGGLAARDGERSRAAEKISALPISRGARLCALARRSRTRARRAGEVLEARSAARGDRGSRLDAIARRRRRWRASWPRIMSRADRGSSVERISPGSTCAGRTLRCPLADARERASDQTA